MLVISDSISDSKAQPESLKKLIYAYWLYEEDNPIILVSSLGCHCSIGQSSHLRPEQFDRAGNKRAG